MLRRKKQQRIAYDPDSMTLNRVPTLKPRGSSKRRRYDAAMDEELLAAFIEEICKRVTNKIRSCYEENKDLDKLKTTLLEFRQLPRGVVTEAEKSIGADAGEIERYLKRKTNAKAAIQHWRDFINENFTTICGTVRRDRKGKGIAMDIESTEYAAFSPQTSESEEAILTTVGLEGEKIRTFTCGLDSIIRPDLPLDIKNAFMNGLSRAIVDASNYMAYYSVQVYRAILLLKNSTFVPENNGDLMLEPKVGTRTQNILPEGFPIDEKFTYIPPPYDNVFLSDERYTKEFEALFSYQHLQEIHSEYFGSIGRRKSKNKQALRETIRPPVVDDDEQTSLFIEADVNPSAAQTSRELEDDSPKESTDLSQRRLTCLNEQQSVELYF
ncbi:hypothetical protein [Parasitella parasitica]|uniref:Uncharacterized protein n=1 Tax=Parasitella parasitica TaxID=35722 RepID=A0A0B7NAD9_9FUNG|nr:hypothetical protein [Parasitella parasitica]